jgi:hypothetical protein
MRGAQLNNELIVVSGWTRAHMPNELSLYARWLLLRANFRESPKGEVRRIHIPRTRVNNTFLTYGRVLGLLGGQSLPLSRWFGSRLTKRDGARRLAL